MRELPHARFLEPAVARSAVGRFQRLYNHGSVA